MRREIHSGHLFWKEMESPIGSIFIGWTENGLVEVDFIEKRSLKQILADLREEGFEPLSGLSAKPADQLTEYFEGRRWSFSCKLEVYGSPFQRKVWNELLKIPYGMTKSYGEIARAIGRPQGARAIGSANHANRISIIVPCHRVIGSDGKLVGYGGGLDRKRWLLDHESRHMRVNFNRGRRYGNEKKSSP